MTGKVEWIGIRPERKAPVIGKKTVNVDLESGIEGDHPASANRQVTIISQEQLESVSTAMGTDVIDPAATRRNIMISGLDFGTLENSKIRIGDVLLEITGPCRPCERMDKNLGDGGRLAMENKGGWTTRVIEQGAISIGDAVTV